MATQSVVDRRRERRIGLAAVTVAIRNLDQKSASKSPITGRAHDVSLTGVLANVPAPFSLRPGTPVSCEITVPRESRKQFPFTRIVGEGWIVRVHQHESKDAGASADVAIAFTGTATALGTIDAY